MAVKKTKKTKTTKKKIVKKKTDIEDVLVELLARFDVVEDKLDTLLSKSAVLSSMISAERDPEFKTRSTVTKKYPIPQDKSPRVRKMHKVICADCNKDCEVPFVPRADRPVYCKTCFSSRRNGISPREIPNREEIAAEIVKTLKLDTVEPSKPKKTKPKKSGSTVSKTKKTKTKITKAKKTKPKVSKAKRPKTKKTKAKKK